MKGRIHAFSRFFGTKNILWLLFAVDFRIKKDIIYL